MQSRQPPLETNPFDPGCAYCGHPRSEHAGSGECMACDCDYYDSDGGDEGWGWLFRD